MFILDTDVVSNLRKKKPHPNLVSWMDEIGWQDPGLLPFVGRAAEPGFKDLQARPTVQRPPNAVNPEAAHAIGQYPRVLPEH